MKFARFQFKVIRYQLWQSRTESGLKFNGYENNKYLIFTGTETIIVC